MITLNDQNIYTIGGISATSLAQKYGTPLYVYDEAIMRGQFHRLDTAFSPIPLRKINYAMKALSNINVLRVMRSMGSGIDAVSVNEVKIAIRAGFAPQDIIYTPNGVPMSEIDEAVALGVHINIDSLDTLTAFAEKHHGVAVGVRINPHIHAGGNEKICTGGKGSKFGISIEYMDILETLVREKNITINGVHMHTGSDIYDVDIFLQGAKLLFSVAERFSTIEYVDFGSGFKVMYRKGDHITDVERLGRKLSKAFNEFTGRCGRPIRFMIEPGKFLVSDSGTLLVTANWVKTTPATTFAQVDSGLNHLIRPMMYDSYHHIVNISNPLAEKKVYDVTGYICETDNFAKDRRLNEVRPGDVLAIMNAGAYGYTMASVYNSRFRPAEVLVRDGKDYLISKADTLEDILSRQVDLG
ncbi:MAG: diaminopimelate decarboxylase [Flavobacteriales bacterium]|nr:diaminopimelate decarboxylase [Flavobacteriales bacterium]